jgi:hypothetical protein
MFGPQRGDVAMSNDDSSSADPFGRIVDEFVEAFRQGQRPSVEEFAQRYPAHADDIRDVLPALGVDGTGQVRGGHTRSTAPGRRGAAASARWSKAN